MSSRKPKSKTIKFLQWFHQFRIRRGPKPVPATTPTSTPHTSSNPLGDETLTTSGLTTQGNDTPGPKNIPETQNAQGQGPPSSTSSTPREGSETTTWTEVESEGSRPADVELFVYDLNEGWAAAASLAVFGKQVDGIWHTSIVVFGREWFYGADGIVNCIPATTNLCDPNQRLSLGSTQVID